MNVLTEEDLKPITGTGTRPAMCAWLNDNKIPYLVARSGWPRVHERAMEYALGVADAPPAANDEIDFGALR